jgi:hypothetical protein
MTLTAAWDWATLANVGVALGTALLALATFKLARHAKAQSDATVELVDLTKRELAATTEPIIRALEPTAGGISSDLLVVTITNTGPVQAVIVGLHLFFGDYYEQHGTSRGGPTVGPGQEKFLDFKRQPNTRPARRVDRTLANSRSGTTALAKSRCASSTWSGTDSNCMPVIIDPPWLSDASLSPHSAKGSACRWIGAI